MKLVVSLDTGMYIDNVLLWEYDDIGILFTQTLGTFNNANLLPKAMFIWYWTCV